MTRICFDSPNLQQDGSWTEKGDMVWEARICKDSLTHTASDLQKSANRTAHVVW